MNNKIKCQNCGALLASRIDGVLIYDTINMDYGPLVQNLCKGSILITLACGKCDCHLQIKDGKGEGK